MSKELLNGTGLNQQSIDILAGRDLAGEFELAKGNVDVDDIATEDMTLVTILVDDSGSMDGEKADELRTALNKFVSDLQNAVRKDSIMIGAFSLNRSLEIPYGILDSFPVIDESNYRPMYGTPLLDRTITVLGNVVMKVKEYEDTGVAVNAITFIMTDGWDTDAEKDNLQKVATIIRDLSNLETYIISAMGFGKGKLNDYGKEYFVDRFGLEEPENMEDAFKKLFAAMNIPDKWSAVSTDDGIRKLFGLASKTVSSASQSSAAFSQVAQTGFGS